MMLLAHAEPAKQGIVGQLLDLLPAVGLVLVGVLAGMVAVLMSRRAWLDARARRAETTD